MWVVYSVNENVTRVLGKTPRGFQPNPIPYVFDDLTQAIDAAHMAGLSEGGRWSAGPAGWQEGKFYCPCGQRFSPDRVGWKECGRRMRWHGLECSFYWCIRDVHPWPEQAIREYQTCP